MFRSSRGKFPPPAVRPISEPEREKQRKHETRFEINTGKSNLKRKTGFYYF